MASLTRSNGYLATQRGHVQGNPWGPHQLEVVGDNATSQSVDKKPSTGIQPRHSSGKKDKEEYFRNHCQNFNNEKTCDLTDVFQHMIETAGLLGFSIYEIQEAWTGWDALQHANYVLRTLPKGYNSFKWYPLESSKVMGLGGIHHPNVVWCFNGVTHCPWCGKEGQNKGTSLTTWGQCITSWVSYAESVPVPIHHDIGLSCHSQKNCQPSVEEGPVSHPHQCNHWHEVC